MEVASKKMRFVRVLGFSVLYFLLFTGYFLFLTIQTLAAVQPHELIWYLQHPLESLASMIIKWGRNPLMVMTFLRMMFGALILGFMTEWGYGLFRKRFRLAI